MPKTKEMTDESLSYKITDSTEIVLDTGKLAIMPCSIASYIFAYFLYDFQCQN